MSIVPMNPFHSYAPVKEIETSKEALEITVSWGDNVLLHEVLSPPRSFSGVAIEGAPSALVEVKDGRVIALVPSAAEGEYVRRSGSLQMSALPASHTEAREFELNEGESVEFTLGNLSFRIATCAAAQEMPKGFLQGLREAAFQQVGLSFAMHAAVIGSLAFLMPRMGADDAEAMDRDQLLLMQKLLNAAADREAEQLEEMQGAGEKSGGEGKPAVGEEGSMGSQVAKAASARWQKAGPKDNPNPQLSRSEKLALVEKDSIIALLSGMNTSDPRGPTAAWAPADGQGRDPQSFLGNMWGADLGDAFGNGGLGLTGGGEGGGGRSNQLGMGAIGTMGHGGGCIGENCGQGFGPGGEGVGHGPNRGAHVPKGPTMRPLNLTANGHLPAEVIQRIVHQNFGRFRNCYTSALQTNPSLTGRVAVRFIIGRDGAVANSQDSGSDLPNQGVVSCVVRSFSNLSFPAPESGIVTVVYPIVFQPGE
jgi:hypothetical protein